MDRFIQYSFIYKKFVPDYEFGEIRRWAKDDRGGDAIKVFF